MHRPRTLTALLLAGALGLAACGGDDGTTATADQTTAAASADQTTAAGGGSDATATKVNANTATADELVAAFEAAGVPSADRWADEVMEYRPYGADETDFARLREELDKYNPPEGVVDQIISVLEL